MRMKREKDQGSSQRLQADRNFYILFGPWDIISKYRLFLVDIVSQTVGQRCAQKDSLGGGRSAKV